MRRRLITSLLIILFLGVPSAIGGPAPQAGGAIVGGEVDLTGRLTDVRFRP
jgi:hypothetical protein